MTGTLCGTPEIDTLELTVLQLKKDIVWGLNKRPRRVGGEHSGESMLSIHNVPDSIPSTSITKKWFKMLTAIVKM